MLYTNWNYSNIEKVVFKAPINDTVIIITFIFILTFVVIIILLDLPFTLPFCPHNNWSFLKPLPPLLQLAYLNVLLNAATVTTACLP